MMQPILYARIVFLAAACGVANLALAPQRTQSFDTDPGYVKIYFDDLHYTATRP